MIPRRTFLATCGAALAACSPTRAVDQPKPAPIKIGQIGVGHPHASKLAAYRASPDYQVVGLVEPDAQLRQQAERQPVYQGLPWLTQEQLLNVPGLQAVLVETRVRDLLATAEASVTAGKHIHVDKPAGDSLPRWRAILATAERQNLLVQMGYMYRYNPGIVLLREFLARGWLGEVFEVHTVMSKVVGPADRQTLAEFPGGMMFELGCHIIDLVHGVLGQPNEIVPFPLHSSRRDDGLMDNMLAVFRYDRATATVKTSALEVEGVDRRHFVVCGTEGTFHIQPLDSPRARVALSQPREGYAKGYQDIPLPKYARYVADAADMARVLRGEKSSDFPYAHDLAVQESVLRASGVSTE
jgi:predicted dehydrogenase